MLIFVVDAKIKWMKKKVCWFFAVDVKILLPHKINDEYIIIKPKLRVKQFYRRVEKKSIRVVHSQFVANRQHPIKTDERFICTEDTYAILEKCSADP